jgi:hypothetical protein
MGTKINEESAQLEQKLLSPEEKSARKRHTGSSGRQKVSETEKNQEISGILSIKYVPIKSVNLWDRNPKLHDLGAMIQSIEEHGFRDAPIYDANLPGIIAGNGRAHALLTMKEAGKPVPLGVALDEQGEWHMPVQFGIDAKSREAAESFGVDHNNLTMMGGDFTLFDMERMWDSDEYRALVDSLAQAEATMISLDWDDVDLLLGVNELELPVHAQIMEYSDEQSEANRDFMRLAVYVKNHDSFEEVIVAVRDLLQGHPEWEAHIP